MAKFGNLGAGVKGSKFLVENVIFGIADPDLPIHYATFMGTVYSLLLSAPIVNHFQAEKTVQCVLGQNLTVFW